MDQGYGTGVVRGVQWILYMFTRSYIYNILLLLLLLLLLILLLILLLLLIYIL